MRSKEELYTISINGEERKALQDLLEDVVKDNYSRQLLAVKIMLDNTAPVNRSIIPTYKPVRLETR